jgi:hypothetical protein
MTTIDYSKYDELLEQAKAAGRESAKTWIPRLCAASRRENPNYSNYDVREIVMKDCISVWQKTTIRDALPDEYKDKQKQKAARIANKVRHRSSQATEFDEGKNKEDPARLNLAENSSFGPKEHDFGYFDKMNSVQVVRTESEKVQKLEKQVSDLKAELNIKNSEIESLGTRIKH